MTKIRERHIFKSDKNRKSFQRWSDHRINQLTAATSLIFAISSAALGYMLSVFSDEEIPIDKLATWRFALAVVAFFISFACGVMLVFNRLKAFRQTCEIIKLRDKGDDYGRLEKLRDNNHASDLWTWRLFKIQVGSFGFGGFLFILYTFGSRWERLKAALDLLF